MLILRLKKSFAFVSQAQSWLRMVCLAQVSRCVGYCKHVGQKCMAKGCSLDCKTSWKCCLILLKPGFSWMLPSFLLVYAAEVFCQDTASSMLRAGALSSSAALLYRICLASWAESNFVPTCIQSLLWNPESLLTERIFQLNLLKFQPSSLKNQRWGGGGDGREVQDEGKYDSCGFGHLR